MHGSMISSNGDDIGKKRKIDDRGGDVTSSAEKETGGGLAEELMAIKSVMNQLLDRSRSQRTDMAQEEIESMKSELKATRGEMEGLRKEMNRAKEEIKELHRKCDATAKILRSTVGDCLKLLEKDTKLENKANYLESQLKNRTWEYLAAHPKRSYWDSIGPVPLQGSAKEFLDQMKNKTHRMRQERLDQILEDDEVRISLWFGGDILPYKYGIFPHWEEFADALRQYQYTLKCLPKHMNSELYLSCMELPPDVLDLLSGALEQTHFKSLDLENNGFGRDGIRFALNYMRNNPILEEFTLEHNPFVSADDADRFYEIVRGHPSIKGVRFHDCFREGGNGGGVLRSIMIAGANKLRKIEFGDNDIARGSAFIGDFLATNPVLEELNLSVNSLDDGDAVPIATSLTRNTNLRLLDVEFNDITVVGWQALRRAEFDGSTLNSAASSNHTCYIACSDEDDDDPWQINGHRDQDEWFDPKVVRRKKVYSVLSFRNRESSNVRHFDDVPVEFFPDMLISIERYSGYHLGDNAPDRDDEYVAALSVVYEIIRRWHKSFSVYESLSSSHSN